jgi:hypothetical protein
MQTITDFLEQQIPFGADCSGCPYLDIDFCNLLEQIVDCKECAINDIEVEPDPTITVEAHNGDLR